jgi:RHS repeat-associated protein
MGESSVKTSQKDNKMKENKKIKIWSTLLFLSISFFAFSQTTQPPKFHDTKGNIDVTPAGQLQYTLNIDVPPGVQQVSPSISLTYTSGGRNGLIGFNWNLVGLSAISRVGKNLEKDGITKGVQLDYTDYYNFNGQRLILKSGEYGKDGAEYVTEKYSNAKIKSIGSITGKPWKGPEYWEVTFDDGSQAWYGSTGSGSTDGRGPLDYNIIKSKDINGNYVAYNYLLDGNLPLITSIQWGGNENMGTQPFNRIDFSYALKTIELAYVKGVEFMTSKLVESVKVSSNNHQYKKYNISYKSDIQGTDYKYLDKITVLNSENEEANPVTFTYEKPIDYSQWGFITFNSSFSTSLKPNANTDVVGDFDGDGNMDLLRYHSQTSARIPQPGVYFYKNFYSITYNTESPVFVNSSLLGLKDYVATNFKKTNVVHNRQGLVGYTKVTNPSTSKKDLQLSFYSLSDNNSLVLDFTKTIANIEQYNFDNPDELEPFGTSFLTILGLDNFDFNGDGLNELVLQLNYRLCTGGGIDPNNPIVDEGNLLPGQTCNNLKKYIVIDPDESIQGTDWYYALELYNSGSEDPFKTYRSGDFDGDGIIDFLKLDQNKKPLLITFKKNLEGKYESEMALFNSTNETIDGDWASSLVGDFNGDGVSDITMPHHENFWKLCISTGSGLSGQSIKVMQPRPNRTVEQIYNDIYIKNPRSFVAYDVNNDGKTEIVCIDAERRYFLAPDQNNNQSPKYIRNSIANIEVYSPTRGWYSLSDTEEHTMTMGIPSVTLYLNSDNLNDELANTSNDIIGLPLNQATGAMLRRIGMVSATPFASDLGERQHLLSLQYFDIARGGRIKSILQGGITTDITYKQLDKVINPGLYDAVKTENYPYVEINQSTGMYVVSQLNQNIAADKNLKQDFRYRGLTSNILGRGMIGFRRMAQSSWYADGFENTKIWSGVEIDPLNDGIPIKEWSIRTNNDLNIFPADISENNSQLLSFKSTTYQIDKLLNGQVVSTVADIDKPKVVTAILPKTTRAKDFLKNVVAENTLSYGQYYLPTVNVAKINTSYSVKTSNFEYSNNPAGIGADYYIGRLTSKIENITAYGDTKSDKQEYTYENNRVKTIKKWNLDDTAYDIDTFVYSDFGNLIKKTSGNSVDSQTLMLITEYDTKGRYIIKQTDNLGLQTQLTYNEWGQILTKTDPLNNIITNTYDNWGKLLTSSTNVGGTTTYQYEKDNNYNTTIIESDPEGDISKSFANKLGQKYKILTKAFGQGQYVSKDTKYDILGRKTGESEPYFDDQTASVWNVLVYDDTVYPTKVTTTSLALLNASGNITSFTGKQVVATISGLTTTISEVNNYNKITSKTVDALGKVISTTDKGGTIQFSYNAAGQQTQATYGGNSVTTEYDTWGRKSKFNDPSNGEYRYEYDAFGRTKKTISPKGEKVYNYNTFGQLISQTEYSTIDSGETTNKTISFTYSDKGLITLKSGIVKGQNFSTAFTYDLQGRLISTVENSNGKIFSQKGLTYDSNGRMISYEKELQSSDITTKVSVENVYSGWNGALSQIKDKSSGKILWQLNGVNEKGQVLQSKLGAVNINNTYDANGFLTSINHSSAVKPGILQISYSFDGIKNELKNRTTSGDFNIVESFDYDDNNRLINWTNAVTGIKPASIRNVYDVKGRILENDQIGMMKFENSAKIYQPTGMTLNTQGEQNYSGDLIQSITFNENNDPVQITGEKSRIKFDYGLGSMRQRVDIVRLKNPIGGGGGEPPISEFSVLESSNLDVPIWQNIFAIYYNEDNSFEVVRNRTTGQEKHIIYIEGSPYESNIVYLKDFAETTGSYKFLHKDYIGSILAISDEAGNKVEQRHFDAWGNFTHLQIGNNPITTDKSAIAAATLLIDRGYTSHEHFMDVGIIHMNGRIYDPLLRRFLNADDNIQDPSNTQNYNKYGYVMNNPMMYNDPNGEFWWWLAGAIAGGYINGVNANNGKLNPVKWDWQNTWSAVLGGAIGGAAISGSFGNIVNNGGAIKTVLPGIVSGGLSSAFSGSNFLGGIMGGISYTSNVFGNKITSTDGISAAYKYIVSPEYNEAGVEEKFFDITPMQAGMYAHRALGIYMTPRSFQGWHSEELLKWWSMDIKMRPDLYYMNNGVNAVWELKPISQAGDSYNLKGRHQAQVYADFLGMVKGGKFYTGSFMGAPRPIINGLVLTDVSGYSFSYTIPVGTDGMIYHNCLNCNSRDRGEEPQQSPYPTPQTVNKVGAATAVIMIIIRILPWVLPS